MRCSSTDFEASAYLHTRAITSAERAISQPHEPLGADPVRGKAAQDVRIARTAD
jgi:hypothetical protein